MPYKDPEKNREAARERQRRYRAAHPEQVRGLACESCNTVIGKTAEDWERMERIAANGRRLQAEARSRINVKPVQGELPIDIKRAARRREESA